ncbi:MAG: hypothetical protein DBY08_04875 [Clostridiales bacterium]|nr:bifunctional oligoribonuclease/PAP phosphatase NrnA [Bacillota bacterium]MEE0516580.1 bifunctional oligoribonuclease/PAP phosphatase NrnA [Anaerovoracaceae bacterium]PWL93460.1 MAG: hypothetical protein DBY08_04875 [Clostridiales bacterium]
MNNSLREIANVLHEAESVLLFPHVNPDGDSIGSCAALCRTLRLRGKEAWILTEDEIPANLVFLDKGYSTKEMDKIQRPDVCICVDCGDVSRFPKRAEKFLLGETTICIDHHMTTRLFCDYNYVDSQEAATGQIIFELLKEFGAEPDKETAEALFAAITTDTGDFQYSNTQKKSHLITAELYDWGADFNKVSVEIYENVRLEKIRLKSAAMETLKIIGGGKGAIVKVSQSMLDKTGALMDESEGLAQELRSIAGVEYSAVLKEYEHELIRVSLRAKRKGDVSQIASALGGGGHLKAAGCTIRETLENAADKVEKEMLAAIQKL